MKRTISAIIIAILVIFNIDTQAIHSEILNIEKAKNAHPRNGGERNLAFSLNTEPSKVPRLFNVSQNYPNPFNTSTVIEYEIPSESKVYFVIYNILGNRIRTLENVIRSPGVYRYIWDGKNDNGELLPSGIYFYIFAIGDYFAVRKMMYLK